MMILLVGAVAMSDMEKKAKEIVLKNSGVTIVDADDFERLSKFDWLSKLSSSGKTFYAVRYFGNKTIRLHHEVLPITKGLEVDHINRNGLDNRKSNLRLVTRKQNSANKPPKAGKICAYKGVSTKIRSEGKISYQVAIVKGGHKKHIGYFENEIYAAIAYDFAAFNEWGECAHLNFPWLRLYFTEAHERGRKEGLEVAIQTILAEARFQEDQRSLKESIVLRNVAESIRTAMEGKDGE